MSEIKNLDKLKRLLVTIDPSLSKEDIVKVLEGALFFLIQELQSIKLASKGEKGDKGDSIKGDSYVLTENDKKEIAKSIKVPVVKEKIKEREIVVEKPIELIREVTKETQVRDEPAESLRDKLESLRGNERIDKTAIKGLEEGVVEKGITLIGGSRGIQLYVDGVKKGLVRTLNLLAGTNITLTHTYSNGRNDILIDGAEGHPFTQLPATGSINSINLDFVFTEKPLYVISDGAWYRENKGWTWNSGTLTATMTIPPNDDLYALI